ncbi:pyridoxamine 5'-phosphate oxidase family protein [Phaeobacter sp. QD34_3]|uniref:pyridoxamine 5'-phosphate oxidase family protein n=1 Tax=unclassified Phaeobacter TaxID=2621772 RepID=UPI00237F7F0D|nr:MULTISPECIES: pyridoxamine 5'-phosphate oxidase family protein [unclassified Phaeobacter]MDE4134019.1 pyridoxamine 5'-phosphate oxidase family protein [Phaeobacter sp. QD34_3]MDE4137761.1 pyridoxamine 5'-phosphate oxidase family protein [Phaeobacter sp. QD34_24]
MPRAFAEIAFTPAVRAHQERMGSARSYGRLLDIPERSGDRIGVAEAAFIADRDGFYQATVSETGWPYVQFRGGPRGFLKVLDDKTIAYADLSGNKQYVSLGNLTENARISMILMDYPNQRRLKIWGTVEVVEGAEATDGLFPSGADATPERAILIRVEAFDWNCPRHIPERLTLEELEPHLAPLRTQLAELKAENARLKAGQPA